MNFGYKFNQLIMKNQKKIRFIQKYHHYITNIQKKNFFFNKY